MLLLESYIKIKVIVKHLKSDLYKREINQEKNLLYYSAI